MLKKIIKAILLQLLKEDYEVQLQVTRTANPDLAYEIETQAKKMPKPPRWYERNLNRKL